MAGSPKEASPQKGPLVNTFSTGSPQVRFHRRNIRLTMLRKMMESSYSSFMTDFVPYDGHVPDDSFFAGLFDDVPTDGLEINMYNPFVSVPSLLCVIRL